MSSTDNPKPQASSATQIGSQPQDEIWMQRALKLAHEAARHGEVPVGAIIVCENEVVVEAANRKEASNDPLGHAEIIAIQAAAQKLGRWRLTGCSLYVTLEPCVMCAGAIVHARLDRVVYGAKDPKAGAVESIYQLLSDPHLNHAPAITSGVLAEEASTMLSTFFRNRRNEKRGE